MPTTGNNIRSTSIHFRPISNLTRGIKTAAAAKAKRRVNLSRRTKKRKWIMMTWLSLPRKVYHLKEQKATASPGSNWKVFLRHNRTLAVLNSLLPNCGKSFKNHLAANLKGILVKGWGKSASGRVRAGDT